MNATTPGSEPDSPIRFPDASATLSDRIAAAQAAIANIVADKTAEIPFKKNDGSYGKFSYTYLTKSTLMAHARQQLAGRGVAIIPSQVSIEQDKNRTVVTMRLTLSHGAESLSMERTGYGHADDDKGPAKGGTSAVRLMLADLLMQGGDEPSGDFEEQEYRPDQTLEPGERPATREQLKFGLDLVMKAQLDKAMPTGGHALLRLARPIAQGNIGAGLEVPDALALIPGTVISKLIERLEKYAENPKGAKTVWDQVAKWETDNGFTPGVDPEDTKVTDPPPLLNARGEEIPF